MKSAKRAVILVGHGGLPSDIPSEIVEIFLILGGRKLEKFLKIKYSVINH